MIGQGKIATMTHATYNDIPISLNLFVLRRLGRKLLELIKFPFDGSRQREPQKGVLDTEDPGGTPYSLLPTESSGSLTCSVYSTDTRRRSSPYLPGRNQY